MLENIAIKVENLSKVYKLYDTPFDRLKEALSPIRRKFHRDFFALKDVSFEIRKGETFGILGKNGSGKSTLLKIIAGVLSPTHGNITVNGKVSALLELGAGFNLELTGVENIYFSGTLMGLTREYMDARLDHILSFADIGEFVYQPVKTYSSGMFVRLAFAVAVNVNPEILVIDEALAVGDVRFQKRCKEKMNEFKDSGATIILVSHSLTDIRSMCSSGMMLHQGKLVHCGDVTDTINQYFEQESKADEENFKSATARTIPSCQQGDIKGTGDAFLDNVICYQLGERPENSEIEFGKAIVVEFEYEAVTPIMKPIITINIGCAYYKVIANISSINHDFSVEALVGIGKIRAVIENPQFYPGAYIVHVALSTEDVNVHYFMHNSAAVFIVKPPSNRLLCYPAALVQPEAKFSIEV